jgi:hypothetical protein
MMRMYDEGYSDIPLPMRVTGMVSGPGERMYNVPGGGQEVQLPEGVPPEFIEPIEFPVVPPL